MIFEGGFWNRIQPKSGNFLQSSGSYRGSTAFLFSILSSWTGVICKLDVKIQKLLEEKQVFSELGKGMERLWYRRPESNRHGVAPARF